MLWIKVLWVKAQLSYTWIAHLGRYKIHKSIFTHNYVLAYETKETVYVFTTGGWKEDWMRNIDDFPSIRYNTIEETIRAADQNPFEGD